MYHHDKDVVPYNKDLVRRYNAHINVEVSGSVKVITYLKKYMTKLPDNSRMSLDSRSSLRDELREWQRMRHVGVAEALMRMRHIPLNKSTVGVTVLYVHKPGENMVAFFEDADDDGVTSDSQLLRYFNRSTDVLLDNVTFADYYSTYTLMDNLPKKSGRKCFRDTCDAPKYACERCRPHVARIEHFKTDDELQAIRDLLRHRPARSFEDLRTINSVTYQSYVQAAEALGIRRANEFAEVLQETINPNVELWGRAGEVPFVGCPHQLRRLFVMMAIAGASTLELFNRFHHYLSIDMPLGSNRRIDDEERNHLLLQSLSDLLFKERLTLTDVGLPEIDDQRDALEAERGRYSRSSLKKTSRAFRHLDPQQREILLQIERSVTGHAPKRARDEHTRNLVQKTSGELFFLQGRPGRGKTFLTNILAARLRQKGHIVAISSPSAKGALHYEGGTTCHKAFGIPIFDADSQHSPQSKITKNSASGKILIAASLIVVDEASMLHQKVINTIDTLLRFLMDNDAPFGGKTVLFSGDTGQLSPVTKLPGRDAAIQASIVAHPMMQRMKVLTLHSSKRQAADVPFSAWLDLLADGNGQDGGFSIEVPDTIGITSNHEEALEWYLQDAIPPQAQNICPSTWDLYSAAIIAYTNQDVDWYNEYILRAVSTATHNDLWETYATEEFAEVSGTNLATPDYMESYHEPGTPDHVFRACIGARCTLTRNYLPSRGLVNGAFLMIMGRTANTITVRNITQGPFFGNEDVLFRFTFNISVKEMFDFNRKQFPLRLAYAGTVHKYQGDTIKGKLLVDCSNPSFAHGQLSVAISRGVTSENIVLCVSRPDFESGSIDGLLYRDLLLEETNSNVNRKRRRDN
jgi:hypothetical protein